MPLLEPPIAMPLVFLPKLLTRRRIVTPPSSVVHRGNFGPTKQPPLPQHIFIIPTHGRKQHPVSHGARSGPPNHDQHRPAAIHGHEGITVGSDEPEPRLHIAE